MKAAAELLQLLQTLGSPGGNVFGAIVSEVFNDNTCTVQAADDTEYYDVRLQAKTNSNGGTVMKPAIGSVVIVENIGGTEYAVKMYSELSEWVTKIGTNTITQSAAGFEVNGNGDTLGKVIGDLLDAIQTITVNVTAVGAPTGVPINSAAFAAIKARLDLFIK